MASTNKTPGANLSQFVENDVPDWIEDVSADMSKIDGKNQSTIEAINRVRPTYAIPGSEVKVSGEIFTDAPKIKSSNVSAYLAQCYDGEKPVRMLRGTVTYTGAPGGKDRIHYTNLSPNINNFVPANADRTAPYALGVPAICIPFWDYDSSHRAKLEDSTFNLCGYSNTGDKLTEGGGKTAGHFKLLRSGPTEKSVSYTKIIFL